MIGWAMTRYLRTELVLTALDMALAQRRSRNIIQHSDQGRQYTAVPFARRCREAGVRPSVGSVDDAYDIPARLAPLVPHPGGIVTPQTR